MLDIKILERQMINTSIRELLQWAKVKKMTIVNREYPPIMEDILNAGLTPPDEAVYTYGDSIFVPNPVLDHLPKDLIVHESIHSLRQQNASCHGLSVPSMSPSYWWQRYLKDDHFRYQEELIAYRVQYACYCENHSNSRKRSEMLLWFAQCLSDPMYGHSMTVSDALRLISLDNG
jgi:hypothetical protein